jgi:hypothetical protein
MYAEEFIVVYVREYSSVCERIVVYVESIVVYAREYSSVCERE